MAPGRCCFLLLLLLLLLLLFLLLAALVPRVAVGPGEREREGSRSQMGGADARQGGGVGGREPPFKNSRELALGSLALSASGYLT